MVTRLELWVTPSTLQENICFSLHDEYEHKNWWLEPTSLVRDDESDCRGLQASVKKKKEKMALKARQYFTHVHLKLYVTYHVYLHTCLWQVHVVPNDVSTNDSINGGTHSFCSLPVFYFIKSVSCNWNPHTFWTKCYLDAIFFQRRVWLSYSYFKKTTCYSPKEMDCSLGV